MRKWLGNFAIFLLSTIVTLGILELILQFLYPAHDAWRMHSIPDPELGWVLEPNAAFNRHTADGIVKVNYNPQGFRDTDFSKPRDAKAIRAVVLGDSYMEANMVALDQVFHKQLERIAQSDGRDIAAYNLGVAGYGTLQEYLAFNKMGAKLDADVVLLAFYLHNDVKNNSEELNAPAKKARGNTRKRPFLDQSEQTQWRINKPDFEAIEKTFRRKRDSLSNQVRYNSVLLTLLRTARHALASNIEAFAGGARFDIHLCTPSEDVERAWHTTERIIRRLKKDVEASGARLVVFSVPSLFDTDPALATEIENKAKAEGSELCIWESPAYRRLATLMKQSDIEYVDLRPAFRDAAGDDPGELFVLGDWHWNGAGHALAARAVHDALESRGYLAE